MIGLRSRLRQRLLGYAFTNPKAVHYPRELAKILGADPANLSRELARLERQGCSDPSAAAGRSTSGALADGR